MVDVSSAKVSKLIVHKVGNKLRDEGFTLSEHETERTNTLDDLLLGNYLGAGIKRGELYDFHHESDLALNVVHHFSDLIFQNSETFVENTKSIAQHLYSASTHPNIEGGEFILILFDNVETEHGPRKALGMFKIEGKNDYLDVKIEEDGFHVIECIGISLEKIQKGAVAIADCKNVYVVDSLGQKTKYWLDSYLKAVPSKTPLVCAKAVGSFVKAISSKVESTEAALDFSHKIKDSLANSESLTFGEIKNISASYVDEEQISEVVSGISSKSGFEMPDDTEIDTKQLTRYARDVVRKARITDGIGLVISNQSATISSIEVNSTNSGIRAVIDIQLKGE